LKKFTHVDCWLSGSAINEKAASPTAGMVDNISNVAGSILNAGTEIANAALADTSQLASVGVFNSQNAVSIGRLIAQASHL